MPTSPRGGLTRRKLLIGAAIGAVPVSGCLGDDDAVTDDGDEATPDDGDDAAGDENGDDEEPPTTDGVISYVPVDQSILVHLDGAVRADRETRDAADAWLAPEPEYTVEDLEAEIDSELGLSPAGIDEVLGFARGWDAIADDQLTVLARTTWPRDPVVEAVETEYRDAYEATSYAGVSDVLYRPADAPDDPTVPLLAVLEADGDGDGTVYALGPEEPIMAALAVAYDGSPALSGPVRDRFDEMAAEGLVRVITEDFAADRFDSIDPEDHEEITFEWLAEAEQGWATYGTGGGALEVAATVQFSSETAAADAHDNLSRFQDAFAAETPNPLFAEIAAGIDLSVAPPEVSAAGSMAVDEMESILEELREGPDVPDVPAVQFGGDFDEDEGVFLITHEGGDSIPASDLVIQTPTDSFTWAELGDVTSVAAGTQVAVPIADADRTGDGRVRILYRPDPETEHVLDEFPIPAE